MVLNFSKNHTNFSNFSKDAAVEMWISEKGLLEDDPYGRQAVNLPRASPFSQTLPSQEPTRAP